MAKPAAHFGPSNAFTSVLSTSGRSQPVARRRFGGPARALQIPRILPATGGHDIPARQTTTVTYLRGREVKVHELKRLAAHENCKFWELEGPEGSIDEPLSTTLARLADLAELVKSPATADHVLRELFEDRCGARSAPTTSDGVNPATEMRCGSQWRPMTMKQLPGPRATADCCGSLRCVVRRKQLGDMP